MKLYLIRHAESQNNAKPLHARIADPGLTARGRLQAIALADYLSDPQNQSVIAGDVITSPFRRALETSLIVRQKSPGPLSIDADVFENGGCFTGHQPSNHAGAAGMNRGAIQTMLDHAGCTASIAPSIDDKGWWNQRPKETDQDAANRAANVCRRWARQYGSASTVMAAILHADFIRTLLREMLDDQALVDDLPAIKNTSITEIDYVAGQFRLIDFNTTPHAAERLVRIGSGPDQK